MFYYLPWDIVAALKEYMKSAIDALVLFMHAPFHPYRTRQLGNGCVMTPAGV